MPVGDCDDKCGYAGRILVGMLAITAIVLSVVASQNCQFLFFENETDTPWEGLGSPFNTSLRAYVGIFSYKIVDAANDADITDGCVPYDEIFGSSPFEALMASQFCAVVAPSFGGLGFLWVIMEVCCCNFTCSFLFGGILFIAAAGIQAGTFALYAEPDFCIDSVDVHNCGVSTSVYLSGVSATLFWCAGLLACCFPRPAPLLSPKAKGESENNGGVVVQPVIMENQKAGYDDYDSGSDEEGTKKQKGDEKITADDFKDHPKVSEGSRVEIKEKTFPDGSRQVDEITHYADGTSSTKTRTFKD